MSLLESLKRLLSGEPPGRPASSEAPQQRRRSPGLKRIGVVDSVCPYCDVRLHKKPARKKKCPDCGNFIYVRTRPLDHQKILVTEQQLDEVEEQWAIANGTHDEFVAQRAEREDERERLRVRLGREPSKADLQWSLYNKELLEYASNNDWGLYRNTRFQMAEHLRKEKRLAPALSTYLEVCHIDLNGPNNLGGITDAEIMKEFPPFGLDPPELAELAPGVVCYVENLLTELELSAEEVEARFRQEAERQYRALKMPRSPAEAWEILHEQLDM